ncbi:MAG TPA: TIGR00282 family metallophosphoesterase [bacterium]|nr:TIGR00282 family metallophosphoesterase [bacterium]
MNILLIGDIIGKPGRHAVHNCMGRIKGDHKIDFVVANGENLAGGAGIQPDSFKAILETGVDVVTSGNHIWSKKEVKEILGHDVRLLRPHNYPPGNAGTGLGIYDCQGIPVAVLNLMGRTFMNINLDCPFRAADKAIQEIGSRAKVILVDMHAETTSEKRAMGWYLDGRVSSVTGTHTHIMTADEEILPGGTAYLTDIGMSGSPNSVIGMKQPQVLSRFISGAPSRFEVSEELPYLFQGVVVSVDTMTGKATRIERIRQTVN